MNRWVALLLAVVGGAIAGYFTAIFSGGAMIGVLWLFVLGDNPWPEGWEYALMAICVAAGLFVWFWTARLIWSRLKPTR